MAVDMEENFNDQDPYTIRKYYRVWILLKYIYVGCADICFWWTVWNIADHLWPMDITEDGVLSYLRGYSSIISANLFYLFIRVVFARFFDRFYEKHTRTVNSAVITTQSKIIKNKPAKFKLLKCFFQVCVYFVVVGFIQVWRGLFATFDYIVELLFIKYKLNRILTSVLFQLMVGFTLAFTQKNNAVNLCPTHKLYKYDELQYLDALFNLHIFNNFRVSEEPPIFVGETIKNENIVDDYDYEEETSDNVCTSGANSRQSTVANIIDHEFDVVKYATNRLMMHLHRSRSRNSLHVTSKVANSPMNVEKNKHWEFVYKTMLDSNFRLQFEERLQDLTKESESDSLNSITDSDVKKKHGGYQSEIERNDLHSTNYVGHRQSSFRETKTDSCKIKTLVQTKLSGTEKNINTTELSKKTKKTNSFLKSFSNRVNPWKKEEKLQTNNSSQDIVISNNFVCDDNENKMTTIQILVQPAAGESTFKENIDEKPASEHKRMQASEHKRMDLVSRGERLFILVLGYLYTIHHRQIFLHVFGGMFWSTTWKLFDYATVPLFTKTASDLPGLALIAMLCHCLNHLVLFRFKEEASGIYWITFWEFFCGIFTVCLWAAVWYTWDIVAMAIGHKLIVCIVLNLLSFGALALGGMTINLAL